MINFLQQLLIFVRGSRTFFYTSLFFPSNIRKDVFTLYGFVRTVDDLVDNIPQNKIAFYNIEQEVLQKKSTNKIVINFLKLQKIKKIKLKLVKNFLDSMKMDLSKKSYSQKELDKYVHGSSSTIGEMMAILLNLPSKSYKSARLLGKSLQLINFIRDIQEDDQLGRLYFAKEELQEFKLKNLHKDYINKHKTNFESFIRYQIYKYLKIQQQAEVGFRYIPRRSLIPIKTASDLYKHTALTIYANPLIVYRKKVKPSLFRIVYQLLVNIYQIKN